MPAHPPNPAGGKNLAGTLGLLNYCSKSHQKIIGGRSPAFMELIG